jgi:hypothetical protein
MIRDIFGQEICVDCDQSCKFGTGRYVNRYAYYGDEIQGWRCGCCAEELDSLLEELQTA